MPPPLLWKQVQDIGPPARTRPAMVFGDGRSVLFGGLSGAALLADTWEWDGELWTQVADIGPPPRTAHAAAFDSVRKRIVLFAGEGESGALFDDTWEWDGDWTQVQDVGPPARSGHALAFDTLRRRAVLFGGSAAAGTVFGDTWEWDGEDWTEVDDGGPSARAGHAFAYDPVRHEPVLFGGADSGGALLGDTWARREASWVQAQNAGPPPTTQAALAGGSEMILWGGSRGSPLAPTRETWSWDGEDWTQRQDIGPSARSGHALSFDPNRSRVVVFGGLGADATPLGDTWELELAAADPGVPAGQAHLAQITVSEPVRVGLQFSITAYLVESVSEPVEVVITADGYPAFSTQILIPPNQDGYTVGAVAVFPVGPLTLVGAIAGDPGSPRAVTFAVEA